MIQREIENQLFSIPESWDDLKLWQLIQLWKLSEGKDVKALPAEEQIEYIVAFLSIALNQPSEVIEAIPYKDFYALFEQVGEITKEMPTPIDVVEPIKINGEKYSFINLEKISFGEFASLNMAAADIPKLLTILIRKVEGKKLKGWFKRVKQMKNFSDFKQLIKPEIKYVHEPFSNEWVEERAEMFSKELSASYAYSVFLFFCLSMKELGQLTADYSGEEENQKQIREMMNTAMEIQLQMMFS